MIIANGNGHCMATIVKPLNLMVATEYERAAMLHGRLFASVHEGYGVLAEEVQEAGDELEKAEAVMRQLLLAIREGRDKAIIDLADYIRDTAINAAAECVQVAAMCAKMVRTVQDEKSTVQAGLPRA